MEAPSSTEQIHFETLKQYISLHLITVDHSRWRQKNKKQAHVQKYNIPYDFCIFILVMLKASTIKFGYLADCNYSFITSMYIKRQLDKIQRTIFLSKRCPRISCACHYSDGRYTYCGAPTFLAHPGVFSRAQPIQLKLQ